MEEGEGNVSPFYLMSEVLEKLRLLNYSASFPNDPINNVYFVVPNVKNKPEGFRRFVKIASWLMKEHLKIDYEELDVFMEVPITVAQSIEHELKKLDIHCDSALKLTTGYGLPVLHALNDLLTLVLNQHDYKFGLPQYADDIHYVEEDTNVEDSDSDNIIDDTGYDDESEEERDYFAQDDIYEAATPQNEIIETDVDSAAWKLELEKVEPQLVLRLTADHKDWRTHVESMEKSRESLNDIHEVTVGTLTKMSEDIAKVTSRIKKREQMLASDHSISLLLEQYRQQQEKLASVTETYKSSEENISKLSSDLVEINSNLDAVKAEVEELSRQMSDTTPLQEIKKAQQRIKREISEMDLRTGVLQHTVLQAKQKSFRSMSAESVRHSRDLSNAGYPY